MNKNLEFLKSNLIAHRGIHNADIPENSIKAFEEAVKNNYIIELDLHILKDNKVVVFHDADLKRMTGVDRVLKETTYDEIKKLKLHNTDYGIPLFKDVLKLVNGRVPLIIELKYDVKSGPLEKETMNILKDYEGKFVIKSFNPATVYWFKKNHPEIIRGQLSSNFKGEKINIIKKIALKNMLFNFITKPDFISYDIKGLPNKRVEKFRRNGLVLSWVIDNKEKMNKAKKNADNFICEKFEEIDG